MKPVILLVDDDPRFLALAERLLSKKRWKVHSVADAEKAIAFMNHTKPQLVVSDLDLPGQSGLELTAHTVNALPDVPVVILTGRGDEQSTIESFMLGAADYVCKESVHQELVRCVGKLLKEERRVAATIKKEMSFAGTATFEVDPSPVTSRKDRPGTWSHRLEIESEQTFRYMAIDVANGLFASGRDWEHCEPRLRVFQRDFRGATNFGTDDIVVTLSRMSAPESERKFPRLAT